MGESLSSTTADCVIRSSPLLMRTFHYNRRVVEPAVVVPRAFAV